MPDGDLDGPYYHANAVSRPINPGAPGRIFQFQKFFSGCGRTKSGETLEATNLQIFKHFLCHVIDNKPKIVDRGYTFLACPPNVGEVDPNLK